MVPRLGHTPARADQRRCAVSTTRKQAARFARIEAKLPAGYAYYLHDQSDAGFRDQPVYGVSLIGPGRGVGHEDSLGYVNRTMGANLTADRPDSDLQQLLLNRAAAALWHRQPRW